MISEDIASSYTYHTVLLMLMLFGGNVVVVVDSAFTSCALDMEKENESLLRLVALVRGVARSGRRWIFGLKDLRPPAPTDHRYSLHFESDNTHTTYQRKITRRKKRKKKQRQAGGTGWQRYVTMQVPGSRESAESLTNHAA